MRGRRVIEINRIANSQSITGDNGLLLQGIRFSYDMLYAMNMDYVVGAATFPEPGTLYNKMGMKTVEIAFFDIAITT